MLIVDDRDDQLRTLRRAVTPWIGALTAKSLSEARSLTLASNAIIQCALIDYVLSGNVTGADVIAVLHEQWPSMPVMLVTGHRDPTIARVARQCRAPVLPKPCSVVEIRAYFDECFDERLATIADMLAVRARVSERQRELVRWRARGLTAKQAAERMGIASGTVGAVTTQLRIHRGVVLDELVERATCMATLAQ